MDDFPHRRYNPLIGEWVLVSPHRTMRPWLGQVEKSVVEHLPVYDPNCYLCPGNIRAGGRKNPNYNSTFVFDNDFPSVFVDEVSEEKNGYHKKGILQAEKVVGVCRVVCFSPRHDLTLPRLTQIEVETVVRTWIEQTEELGNKDFISYVQIFENKGEMMGCSNPHPHCQIWATSILPNEPAKEIFHLKQYKEQNKGCMLCDYLSEEEGLRERIVVENDAFAALVPYWAIWPYEILLLSRRHFGSFIGMTEGEISGLADILKRITQRYDNLFQISFPYSMGFHQTPTDGFDYDEFHFHAHFYPPLLRSAQIRKFMVGYEMLAMPQRDLTPETAAERLRNTGEDNI